MAAEGAKDPPTITGAGLRNLERGTLKVAGKKGVLHRVQKVDGAQKKGTKEKAGRKRFNGWGGGGGLVCGWGVDFYKNCAQVKNNGVQRG